jgi:hypothetical protein
MSPKIRAVKLICVWTYVYLIIIIYTYLHMSTYRARYLETHVLPGSHSSMSSFASHMFCSQDLYLCSIPLLMPPWWTPGNWLMEFNRAVGCRFITPITVVYDTQITIVNGIYKPTYNWGAPHCRVLFCFSSKVSPWFRQWTSLLSQQYRSAVFLAAMANTDAELLAARQTTVSLVQDLRPRSSSLQQMIDQALICSEERSICSLCRILWTW